MKIGYVTTYDANDISKWSGLGYYISKSIKDQGHDLFYFGNLKYQPTKSTLSKYKISQLFGIDYPVDRDIAVSKNYAKQIERRITKDLDLLFSPSTTPIAFVKTKIPKVVYIDATFRSMLNYYSEYKNISKLARMNAEVIESEALSSAELCLFASKWAADEAMSYYNLSKNKVKVIPFGANFTSAMTIDEIIDNTENKQFNKIKLLFVGVDWERKGGDILLEIAHQIHLKGGKVQVDIVGIKNKPITNLPDFVVNHGFLDKNDDFQLKRLINLYKDAHFFVMPSKAECFGIVYSEANSFGVPVIGLKTGGVSTIIKNGVNGMIFPINEYPINMANEILQIFNDKTVYNKMSLRSFNEYSERLNWGSSGELISGYLNNLLTN